MEYSIFLLIVFILSSVLGFKFAENNPVIAGDMVQNLMEGFSFLKDLNPLLLLLVIFLNNAGKSLILVLTGVALGVIPVFFIFYNGFMVGVVVNVVSGERGVLPVIAALLPHGIIEIPMVVFSGALGLWMGAGLYRKLRGHPVILKKRLRESMSYYARFVIPLLFLAAVIETFISPYVGKV
jgi:stage II sporulation protein M